MQLSICPLSALLCLLCLWTPQTVSLSASHGTFQRIRHTAAHHYSKVTLCDAYNRLHANGAGACDECTAMTFDTAAQVKLPNSYTEATLPGSSVLFPVLRPPSNVATPINPRTKKKDKSLLRHCMWCPELKVCGSPRLSDIEAGVPCADASAQLGPVSGPWLPSEQCIDDPKRITDMYKAQAPIRASQRLGKAVEDVVKDAKQDQGQLTLPISRQARESQAMSSIDDNKQWECLGECVLSGVSSCNPTLVLPLSSSSSSESSSMSSPNPAFPNTAPEPPRPPKLHPDQNTVFPPTAPTNRPAKFSFGSAQQAQDNTSPDDSTGRSTATTAVPCAHTVTAGEVGMRAWGRYDIHEWIECLVIPCVVPLVQQQLEKQQKGLAP